MDGIVRKDRVQRGACVIYNYVKAKALKENIAIPVRKIKEYDCLTAEDLVVKAIMSSNNDLVNDPDFLPSL